MKTHKLIVLVAFTVSFLGFVSCGNETKSNANTPSDSKVELSKDVEKESKDEVVEKYKSNTTSDSKIELNKEVKKGVNDEAVEEYFKTLNSVVEEYITMLEMMTKATESNGGSDMENSLGALTSMTSSVTKMAPLLKRMEELSQESEILQKEMSEKELQLFLNSYAKIMFRLSKMGTIK